MPGNYPNLQFTEQSRTDITETWDYIAQDNVEIAIRFTTEIIDLCEKLARNPKIGFERDDLIGSLRQFPFRNYNIFYFPIENGIEIYRVLHSSRDIIQVFDRALDDKT